LYERPQGDVPGVPGADLFKEATMTSTTVILDGDFRDQRGRRLFYDLLAGRNEHCMLRQRDDLEPWQFRCVDEETIEVGSELYDRLPDYLGEENT
jgi:hypothetical protein